MLASGTTSGTPPEARPGNTPRYRHIRLAPPFATQPQRGSSMSTRTSIVCLSLIAALTGCAGARATPSPSPGAPPPVTRAGLTRMIDSMVNAPEFRTALWGVLIVDPDARDTLYAHNAAKLFIPASNQKLVSGSVMLEPLGPGAAERGVR